MKLKISLLAFATILFTSVFANPALRQVIVLNEGPFGGPVTVGSYNPNTHQYSNFATVPAAFASAVIIDGSSIYVAADSLLLQFDLISKQLLHQVTVKGVRELCVWNNQLLVTRADIASLPSYFQVYNKSDLSFVYELTNLSGRAAEVKVLNDSAYVAINDFGAMGKLAVIDLNNQTLSREIDLGSNGLNPESVNIYNGKVYTMSSPNWTDISVSQLTPTGVQPQTTLLGVSSSCSASAMYMTNIFLQVSAENKLRVYNTLSASIFDSLETNQTAYGMGIDPVNAHLYCGVTDFTSTGKVFIYDFFGNAIDSFEVNVSPGSFAFDVVNTTSIEDASSTVAFSMSPNPCNTSTSVFVQEVGTLSITNALGQVIREESLLSGRNEINTSTLASGVYFLRVSNAKGSTVQKLVRQ